MGPVQEQGLLGIPVSWPGIVEALADPVAGSSGMRSTCVR